VMPMAPSMATTIVPTTQSNTATFLRALLVGLTAFLTVVDLFATQAILPALTRAYGTTPAVMSFAVNASTIGMAISGLIMALLGHRVDRRLGILLSLTLLSVPTLLLATMPNLVVFAGLRVVQGLLMAAAFTLTLAYIGETSTPQGTATAFAAYITGNVASNLVGRLVSAAVADHFGLAWNFYAFAALNLCGALLVYVTIRRRPMMMRGATPMMGTLTAWLANLRDPALRAAFAVGFCILFAFIGTFTYINFVLVRQPFALGMMELGFVYFVFLPSVVSTPFAGRLALRCGTRTTCSGALALAALGLPLLLLPSLSAVSLGLVLLSVGTFFAQAVATGFVGRAARADRAAASGMYLACYFLGGLVGSVTLGQVYDRLGWPACVGGITLALFGAMFLTPRLLIRDQA
jgi:MFS transporter, YNFM family, putative membrane transport protein